MWDLKTLNIQYSFKPYDLTPKPVTQTPDGKYIITSPHEMGEKYKDPLPIKLWDIETGQLYKELEGKVLSGFSGSNEWGVKGLVQDPAGQYLITAIYDSIIVWNQTTGRIQSFTESLEWPIYKYAYDPSRNCIFGTITHDSKVYQWDVSTGKLIKSFTPKAATGEINIDDSKKYMVITGPYNIEVLDLATLQQLSKAHHSYPSEDATIHPSGEYLITRSRRWIQIWRLPEAELYYEFATGQNEEYIRDAQFDASGKHLLILTTENIQMLELASKSFVRGFGEFTPERVKVALNPVNNDLVITRGDATLDIRRFDTLKPVQSLKAPRHPENVKWSNTPDVYVSPDGRYLAAEVWEGSWHNIKIWDNHTGTLLKTINPSIESTSLFFVGFLPDNSGFITMDNGKITEGKDGTWIYSRWSLPDLELEKTSGKINVGGTNREYARPQAIDPTGKYMIHSKHIKIYDLQTMRLIKKHDWPRQKLKKQWVTKEPLNGFPIQMIRGFSFDACAIHPSGTSCAITGSDGKTRFYSLDKKGILFKSSEFHETDQFVAGGRPIAYDPSGKIIAAGGALWDVATRGKMRDLQGYVGLYADDFSQFLFTKDSRFLLLKDRDRCIKIWRVDTGDLLNLLFFGNEWLMFTPDGYFDASRNGGRLVGLNKGIQGFAVDQFALKYNRPDIILERMGIGSEALINHYESQYKRRLRRFGIQEADLASELSVPQVKILNTRRNGKSVSVQFSLKDNIYPLKRYNIYVNDVPLFGGYGREISGNAVQKTETVELTTGTNKIEVTCFNSAGAESFRAITYAEYQEEVQPDLYYLGFGVSQYQNPDLNLSYAHKDALDLANTFQGLSEKFGNVRVKTFTDDQVTVQNIKEAKTFLKDAKVDDIFVLFIAGHGVYSTGQDATYYYLTYNTDLANLSQTAADFDLIEDLLQGVKPRKKLFLMDTCESGEIDEETQSSYYALADSRGIKARTSRAVVFRERTKQPKRSYLYQKDRYIYNDLIRRSGAIVFSSSKGGEFSYESDAVQNGFFTEEILKCLTQGAGDTNGDGTVSTDELRNYVSETVAKATNDAQHPTVDRDNIYQKFGFPVKK